MNQNNLWDSWTINPNRKVNMRLPGGRRVVGSFPYGGKRKTVTSPIKLGPYTGGFVPPEPEAELGFGKRLFTPGFLGKAVADLFRSIRGAEPARPVEAVTGAGAVRKDIGAGAEKPLMGAGGFYGETEPTETKQIFVDEKGGKTTVTYKRAEKAKVTPIEGAIPKRGVIGELGPISTAARPAIGEGMPEMPSASKYQMWMSDPQNRLLLAGIAQAFGGPGSWQAGIGRMQEEAAIGELYKEALGETAYEGPTGYGVGPEFISSVLAQKAGAEELARKAGLEEREMGVGERKMTLLEEQAEVAKRIGEAQIGQIRASTKLDEARAVELGKPAEDKLKTVRSLDLFGDGTAWDVGVTEAGRQFIIGQSAVSAPRVTERNVATRVAALYVPRVREYLQRLVTPESLKTKDPLAIRANELLTADKLSNVISDLMTGESSYAKLLELMSEFGMQELMDQMRTEHKARLRGVGGVPAGEITEPEAYEGLIY